MSCKTSLYWILPAGGSTQLTKDRTNNINPRWSPDGGSILYDANMGVEAERAITPDLMTVDLQGNCKTLLSGWTVISAASFTPDGRRIVFIVRPTDGSPIGTKSDLYTLDLATLTVECRTAALKVGVGGYLSMDMPVAGIDAANTAVSDDGAFAITPVQAGGTNHAYRVALAGEEDCRALTDGDCAIYPQDLAGEKLLYARIELNAPPELWIQDLSSGERRQLTQLNAEHLERIQLPGNGAFTLAKPRWRASRGLVHETAGRRGALPPRFCTFTAARTQLMAMPSILISRCWRARATVCSFSIIAPRPDTAMHSPPR